MMKTTNKIMKKNNRICKMKARVKEMAKEKAKLKVKMKSNKNRIK